jgi:arabinofuranosyltransferase
MPAYRFVAPILPLCFLFIYLALRPYLDALDDKKRLLYWGGFIAVSALQLWTFGGERRPADPAAFCGETVGRHIQAHWPADALVALNTAGSIPYFAADQRFIDMLGLNDAHIAHRHPIPQRTPWQQVSGHAKGDGAYVLDRQPDYIILGPAQGVDADAPYFLSDIEISEDPRFARHYRREQVTLDVSQRQDHHFYLATRSGTLTFTYFRRR